MRVARFLLIVAVATFVAAAISGLRWPPASLSSLIKDSIGLIVLFVPFSIFFHSVISLPVLLFLSRRNTHWGITGASLAIVSGVPVMTGFYDTLSLAIFGDMGFLLATLVPKGADNQRSKA